MTFPLFLAIQGVIFASFTSIVAPLYPQAKSDGAVDNPVVLTTQEDRVAYIRSTAQRVGISEGLFVELADCESGFEPKAINPADTDNLPKYGVYQFATSTFVGHASLYKLPYTIDNISEFAPNVEVAARMIADDKLWHWGKHCRNRAIAAEKQSS